MARPKVDFTGKRVGKWKVLAEVKTISNSKKLRSWTCECATCGAVKAIKHATLLIGHPKPCGNCNIARTVEAKKQVQAATVKMVGVKAPVPLGVMPRERKVAASGVDIGFAEAKMYAAGVKWRNW